MDGENKEILHNVTRIVEEHMTWAQAIETFDIKDPNLQRVYIRYVIDHYSMMDALFLLSTDSTDSL